MTSKLSAPDAREWLESLQLSGEGWYRQVALAIRAGAPKALKMDRKEFVATIGQRMIDPRPAIVELHREGTAQRVIADILGVSPSTVHNVLLEEGLIEGRLHHHGRQKALSDAEGNGSEDGTDAEGGDAEAEIEELALKLKAERARRKREAEGYQAALDKARKDRIRLVREARDKALAEANEEDLERVRKEAEAEAEEAGRKVMAGMVDLSVQGVIGGLEDATERLKTIVSFGGGLTGRNIQQIDRALAGFNEELNVAKLAVDIDS